MNLSRTYGNYTFLANFMLVAAMNPCPCGCFPMQIVHVHLCRSKRIRIVLNVLRDRSIYVWKLLK
ncbi:MAG: ATP-binding protein [Anaerobutyricum sp.]